MQEPQKRGVFRVDLDMEREDAHGLLRGTFTPRTPLVVSWFMGSKKPMDFIWANMVGPQFVSARVIDALTN